MIKTQIQKVFAVVALLAIATSNFSAVSAATQIGTGSVTGSGAFDAAIMWDDNFPGTASGAVSNIKVKARVNPSLNMTISAEEIDLGTLVSGVASTGSLFIEIGTNAKSGVSVTARSQSGGLTNTGDAGIQINDLVADGLAESYTWESVINVTDDSVSPAFSAENATGDGLDTAVEVNENATEYNVYTTNKSEAANLVDDVEFIVSATSGAETPAGDYEDYVTFTVTGNF